MEVDSAALEISLENAMREWSAKEDEHDAKLVQLASHPTADLTAHVQAFPLRQVAVRTPPDPSLGPVRTRPMVPLVRPRPKAEADVSRPPAPIPRVAPQQHGVPTAHLSPSQPASTVPVQPRHTNTGYVSHLYQHTAQFRPQVGGRVTVVANAYPQPKAPVLPSSMPAKKYEREEVFRPSRFVATPYNAASLYAATKRDASLAVLPQRSSDTDRASAVQEVLPGPSTVGSAAARKLLSPRTIAYVQEIQCAIQSPSVPSPQPALQTPPRPQSMPISQVAPSRSESTGAVQTRRPSMVSERSIHYPEAVGQPFYALSIARSDHMNMKTRGTVGAISPSSPLLTGVTSDISPGSSGIVQPLTVQESDPVEDPRDVQALSQAQLDQQLEMDIQRELETEAYIMHLTSAQESADAVRRAEPVEPVSDDAWISAELTQTTLRERYHEAEEELLLSNPPDAVRELTLDAMRSGLIPY